MIKHFCLSLGALWIFAVPAASAQQPTTTFNIENARQTSAKLPKARKQEARSYFSSAFELLKSGENAAAIVQFERGLAIDPADFLARYYLATAHELTGNARLAEENYTAVVALAPKTAKESALAEMKLLTVSDAAAWQKIQDDPRPGIHRIFLNRFPNSQYAGAAAIKAGNWTLDTKSGCFVLNNNPARGDSVEWTGGCRDNLAHGQGTATWNAGTRVTGLFELGRPTGELEYTYSDGSKARGNIGDRGRTGTWTIFNASGAPTGYEVYENGKFIRSYK